MAVPITVPRLGWNMDEGVFVGWLKADGATLRAGEALFNLEGEKATEEIECLDSGILRIPPDGPRPGDKVAVGATIACIVQPGEAPPWEGKTRQRAAAHAPPKEASLPRAELAPATVAGGRDRSRRAISPRAWRVAQELGVDWSNLRGSGRTGRIRERDVRAAAAVPQGKVIPPSPVRRTIAERMHASHRSTAPVTLTTTADATNLVNLRSQFKAAGEGSVPGYTDFLVKLAALALPKHPLLNARLEGDRILVSEAIDIGIAVDTDSGLLVPVVRDVPSLPLKELAARARDLAERARLGKLKAEEMQGGTFTVTNLGQFGIDAFTPIINLPQCAILGVGRIRRRPAVIDGQVTARDEITLSLTFDHRIVDGAPAARFLQTLSLLVENPGAGLIP
jgi:pyruvate dehydrogenase E2 component (dihydrolipoamide acetyltransferase)